jgi:hypothetical protein
MYDFLDAVVSPADGSVWSSWVDTCTSLDSCSRTRGVGFNAGTETQGVSGDMRGLATRQIGGPTLTTPVCNKKRC